MNPLKIYSYEPLNRKNLTLPARIIVWWIEYFARVIGAVYISIILLIVSVIPKKSMSYTFFRIIGNVADMYRAKWMREENEQVKGSTGLEKGDGEQVQPVEKEVKESRENHRG